MKAKILSIFSVILIVAVFAAACGSGDVSAKIISQTETELAIECTADGGTLEDALTALSEAGKLSFSGDDGDFGLYITEVNGRSADPAKNEYWAIYTTLGELDGVAYSSAEYGSRECGGRICASASYGASGLPMVAGELYVLSLESY